MKKLVFAAIAAMVMVSVSNVFANNKMASVSSVAPVDTVAPTEPADTTVEKSTPEVTPAETPEVTPAETPTETPADSTTTDSAANTAVAE